MTKSNISLVNNVTMIYSAKQLRSMFEEQREELNLSRRAYAIKLDISPARAQSWFRPERERNDINYPDATKIIEASRRLPSPEPEIDDIARTPDIAARVSMLEQIVIKLALEVSHRNPQPISTNNLEKA